MENLKTKKQARIYFYECSVCGNEFSKDYSVNPERCFKCNSENKFTCRIESVRVEKQYCPICKTYFETSPYLSLQIKDKHALWLANMVTHYRHNHITSWNKMWGEYGNYYRYNWYYKVDYDSMKIKVNEQAKRQILRKCKEYMIDNGFTVEHVKQLQHTDGKTIALYEKILGVFSENQDVMAINNN